MEVKRPGKLNFNAPLLSTKRLNGCSNTVISNSEENLIRSGGSLASISRDTSNRVPFLWEQAPGKPKHIRTSDNDEAETPRPRLPPGRLPPPNPSVCVWVDRRDDDDTAEAEVEEEEAFSESEAVDSLTEAIDIVEKTQELEPDFLPNPKNESDGYLNLESVVEKGCLSPTYILERFLPDATALAASSILAVSDNKTCIGCVDRCQEDGDCSYCSPSSPKGCGFEILLPWRRKVRICGVRSPVRRDTQQLAMQTKRRPKHKKY